MPLAPTPDQLRDLVESTVDSPVVMLNLLRFRDRATGGTGRDGLSGREAYARYGANVRPFLEAVGGRVLWQGRADSVVIGGSDDAWDAVILVEYPSRRAFLEMVSSPRYQAVAADREAALEDSRLIATTAMTPGSHP